MAQKEYVYKEAVAVFAWLATTLSVVFVTGVFILRPWTFDEKTAYANAQNYEADVDLVKTPDMYEVSTPDNESETENSFQPVDFELSNVPYSDMKHSYYVAEELPYEYRSPYMAYSFFIPENEETYIKFHSERPDLDAKTVVWMVNVHLHLPFFYRIYVNEDPNPLLINSFYRLPTGFMPQDLVPVTHENCRFRATPETAAAFRRLRASAQEAGFNITLASAFRSASRQHEIFLARGARDGRTMRPYHSEHQTGRALDLNGPGGRLLDRAGPTPTGAWVAENAHLYGFIMRYRAETTHITGIDHEPWHITYVGAEISMYMNDNGILSLEEFVGRNPGVGLGRLVHPTSTSGLSLSSVAGPILGTLISSSTD